MRFRSLVSHVICRYCSARQKFSLGHPSEMLDQVRQICRANLRKLVCIARNGEKKNTQETEEKHMLKRRRKPRRSVIPKVLCIHCWIRVRLGQDRHLRF